MPTSVILTLSEAVAFLVQYQGGLNIFSFLGVFARREVSCVEYITWDDLIMIAMLIIAILNCYINYMNNNKKR